MRRLLAALLASLILAGLVVPAAGVIAGAPAAHGANAVAKVVIVVGPAGAATNRYRKEARSAAALARKYTPDVTEVYSPNATWPAVKEALQGASLVIYMGHGNGWPSKYRDSLYPPSQNGFGLNPELGSGDRAHQYFGEGRIAESINLAKNAVVLLNHLCYASGLSEPGLAEGTLSQAKQRVDNYAAGFIKAGAAAVIAEAYASPNNMVRAVLGGGRSIEAAWRGAPSRNGNAFAFESKRSPGYIAQMDPERGTSGFARSIVLKAGLASSDVLRNARGSANAAAQPSIDPESLVPSLAAAGVETQEPFIDSSTAAGSQLKFKVRYSVKDRKALPKTILASVRWDRLDAEAAPVAADPATEASTAAVEGEASAAPAAGAEASAPASAEASPAAEPAAEPAGPPDLGLVTAEHLGDVVAPAKIKIIKSAFLLYTAAPAAPGRYRLSVTLHDEEGVAFDAATQALVGHPLIVRVTGELDAQIVAPSRAEVAAGEPTGLDLWVANLGKKAWGHGAIKDTKDPDGTAAATAATVSGQWLALGDASTEALAAAGAASATATLPAGLEPGAIVPADLSLFAPSVPGDYLLVLDIVTPEQGSIVAAGVEPTLIRVHVAAKSAEAAPAATPAPATSAPTTEGAPASSEAN